MWPGHSFLHALSPTFIRLHPARRVTRCLHHEVLRSLSASDVNPVAFKKVANSQKQPWKMSIMLFKARTLRLPRFYSTEDVRAFLRQGWLLARRLLTAGQIQKQMFWAKSILPQNIIVFTQILCTLSHFSEVRNAVFSVPKHKSTLRYSLHHWTWHEEGTLLLLNLHSSDSYLSKSAAWVFSPQYEKTFRFIIQLWDNKPLYPAPNNLSARNAHNTQM